MTGSKSLSQSTLSSTSLDNAERAGAMNIFHCDHCDHVVFFENTRCVHCGHTLAFLPDLGRMGSLDEGEGGTWRVPPPNGSGETTYRLCTNYSEHNVCNWALLADDPQALCVSCRLTRVIPDLSAAENLAAWSSLETAKRRLVYTLLRMKLPLASKVADVDCGLAFDFLSDALVSGQILTGHADGVITLNIAEADDAERERRRLQLHEPYRTLLGHFRHESGHYYWDRLVRDTPRLDRFRAVFGDERQDYAAALQRHYENGPAADWSEHFISAYATSHPWEDWAETWAHYLHMTDTVETAAQCGLSLRPRRQGEPSLRQLPERAGSSSAFFNRLIESWFPLTYVLNNLNRGLGLHDAYPFVLSPAAIAKLQFVHETVVAAANRPRPRSTAPKRSSQPGGGTASTQDAATTAVNEPVAVQPISPESPVTDPPENSGAPVANEEDVAQPV